IDELAPEPGDHVVHVGCGTGYYTAILAHMVVPSGRVTAIEIDAELADRARRNLAHLPYVEVVQGDGSRYDPGPADAVFINAGVNYLPAEWLNSLRTGGRLVFPVITTRETWIRPFTRRGAAPIRGPIKRRLVGLMIKLE